MSDDQFTKLFKYISDIDARTRRIEDEMSTKSSIDNLTDTITPLSSASTTPRVSRSRATPSEIA